MPTGKETSASEFASSFLKLILQAVPYANMADNAGTAPFTNIYAALHTASPGANGTQTTNECGTNYAGYARVAIARTAGGWTVTANSASPAANIVFPAMTSGTGETATYLSLGTSVSGAGHLLWFGPLSPTVSIVTGVVPTVLASSTVVET